MSSEAGPSTTTSTNPTTPTKRERSEDGDERPSKRPRDDMDADQDASGDDDDEHPVDKSVTPTLADRGIPLDDEDAAFAEVVEATLMADSPAREPSETQPAAEDSMTSHDRASSALAPPPVETADSEDLEVKSLRDSPAPAKPAPLGTELAEYACPICFTPPTNATLTPCGHICCGSCLFSAIKIAATRNVGQEFSAKCPVCRANIPGWDGHGGGVIGLKPKVVYSF